MKVLLRNTNTGCYYSGLNGWVASAMEASDYASVQKATRFALDENLSAAEIVLKSDVLPDEVVVPVLSEWCGLGSEQEAYPSSHAVRAPSIELRVDKPEPVTG
jgi:hypothetical protein